MPTPLRRFLPFSAVLLLLGLVLLAARPAAAQGSCPPGKLCTDSPPILNNPPPDDNIPPTVNITPSGGSYGAASLSVTVQWSDAGYLSAGSRHITLNGVDVTGSFSYTGGNTSATSTGTVTLNSGSNTLVASICDLHTNCNQDVASYTYTPPTYGVSVTPDGQAVSVAAGASTTRAFTVSNTGNQSVTYTLTPTCSGTATGCSASVGSKTLAGGASGTVNVSYTVGAGGTTGTVKLTATQSNNSAITDQGSINVSVSVGALTVSVSAVNPGTTLERSLCLTAAMGGTAASECGDLFLAHALPTTRTLNKARTPTLTYNSQHAHPYPIVAANVSLPSTAISPDSMVAILKVGTTQRARGKWTGSQWPSGATRRIALGYDALADATGRYSYTLEVTAWHAGSPTTTTASGQLVIVNRSGGSIGAGWSLSGHEEIRGLSTTEKLWIGAAGSTRVYTATGTANVWVAPGVDHPDTLKYDGTYFTRYLPGGGRVTFNSTGQHVATIDRLGHQTSFAYVGGRVSKITLPSGSTARSYSFAYDAAHKLHTVTAPPIGGTARVTTLTITSGRLDRITDPDGSYVRFGYDSGFANRITSSYDRRGWVTTYGFDAAKRLSQATVDMGSGQSDLITTLRTPESQVLAPNAKDPSLVYALLNGPRTDVGDTTEFHLDGFGQVEEIKNALGNTTTLLRGDSRWSGLVTEVQYPNGRITRATYNARGNVKTTTEVNPYGDGQSAVMRYEYTSTAWPDFATRVVPLLGDSTVISYDATTGNRLWQQDARGSTSRVNFGYGDSGLLTSITYPGGAKDSLTYNAGQKNLSTARTPRGFVTTFYKDNVGRDTLVVSPIDSLQSHKQKQRSVYDLMDRVTLSQSIGPALGTAPAETLSVHTYYNLEGAVDSILRWSSPDSTFVGKIKTAWTHDAALRVVKEIAPDLEVDSTVYDPAGNPTRVLTRRTDPTSGARIQITMQYDALNRLTLRSLPEVHYGSRYAGIPYQYGTGVGTCSTSVLPFQRKYPSLPNDGACGYRIPADVQTFGYDALGNLTVADNADAQIRRSYYTNGQLKTDSLRIRTTDGNNFSSHAYGLKYHYDLDGRRTQLDHPAQLAPSSTQNQTSYAYDPLTGALSTVTDPMGNEYGYVYNLRGLVNRVDLPGGVSDGYVFDNDGNLSTHTTTAVQSLRGALLTYDARGKLLRLQNLSGTRDTLSFGYSGLGALVTGESTRHPVISVPTKRETGSEAYGYDALGNVATSHTMRMPPGVNATQQTRTPEYDHTGRLVVSQNWRRIPYGGGFREIQDREHRLYDEAGNEVFRSQYYGWYGVSGSCDSQSKNEADCEDRASYYAADGRLRAAEHRTRAGTDGLDRWDVTFEEYRYDALGRRVWVRSRGECGGHELIGGPASCQSTLRRTVWDGDQELYEIQMPGESGSLYLENDTALIPVRSYRAAWPVLGTNDFFAYDPNASFGRVLYTNGLGVDRPLGLVRMDLQRYWPSAPPGTGGQATTFSTFSITPLWNWRGEADAARFADGSADRCQTFSSGTYCISVSDTTGGAWGAYQPGGQFGAGLVHDWFGTLLTGKQDATGTLYRRARYYDPQTGRFTQEDPIGLAGGLNLYGYAGGDPVNLSDPSGKCFTCIGAAVGLVAGAAVYHFTTPPGQRSWRGYLTYAAGGASIGATLGFAAGELGLLGGGATAATAGSRGTGIPGAIEVVSFEGGSAASAASQLAAPSGKKLAQMIARWGGSGGRDAFMEFAEEFVTTARSAGQVAAGQVGSLVDATVYRVGNSYLVVDSSNVLRSFVADATRPDGIVAVYHALGGR
jgi:RHS repeat-associated protein